MRGSVFLSYPRSRKAWVVDLAQRLRTGGLDVFLDENLEVGGDYPKQLREEIESRDYFLVVITPEILESSWIQREIEIATNSSRDIVPIDLLPTDRGDVRFPTKLYHAHAVCALDNKDPLPDLFRLFLSSNIAIHVGYPAEVVSALKQRIRSWGISLCLFIIAILAVVTSSGMFTGPQGLPGPPGSRGAQGAPGARGATGPIGAVVAWPAAQASIPEGWHLCDGSLLAESEYSRLANVLGSTYGSSEDGDRIRLPDYRGYFLRGVDTRSEPTRIDKGPRHGGQTAGSTEEFGTARPSNFRFKSDGDHVHAIGFPHDSKLGEGHFGLIGITSQNPDVRETLRDKNAAEALRGGPAKTWVDRARKDGSLERKFGGHEHIVEGWDSETRPVNIAVHWIIRVK